MEEGASRIVDRLKDMVKVSGYNVYPTEVEEVLYRHPKVACACVVGADGAGGEMVKAFIVLHPGERATAEEILEWCGDPHTGLSGFRILRAIEFRDTLRETLIGKVLRRALREEEIARQAAAARA
jgi:long-chain acyl-CoA synthetase